MKNIFTYLILLIPFIGFGQENSFNLLSSEKSNIFFDSKDFMYKTDERFKLQIPKNYNFIRFGRDKNVLSVYKKIEQKEVYDVSGNITSQIISEFHIADIKHSLQKNKELLNLSKMTKIEIENWVKELVEYRNNDINLKNEKALIHYSKNNLWMINEGFSTEKNLYIITASLLKNSNSISINLVSNVRGNKFDLENVKKLIDNIIFY
tara:strand:+ start:4798 stop:5418 length:621 start_codon:yes stop_codon:yes gene_type:complete